MRIATPEMLMAELPLKFWNCNVTLLDVICSEPFTTSGAEKTMLD